VQGEVVKVSAPRTDLSVEVNGSPMVPFQGLTSWAAFQPAGEQTMVMGDIVVTEDEANPALTAALDGGLEVTALHNHFFFERPRVFFMHIGGHGGVEQLARAVAATFAAVDAAARARKAGAAPAGFAGPAVTGPSRLQAKPLENVFGVAGQVKDGMVKFVIGRTARMHGSEVGAAMGINTWAAFAGTPDAAVVDGDFAIHEDELQGVLKALRHAGINIVAIHNHMTGEDPRFVFLHYWGSGNALALAAGVKAAIDTQQR
jgi:hypothetical protein